MNTDFLQFGKRVPYKLAKKKYIIKGTVQNVKGDGTSLQPEKRLWVNGTEVFPQHAYLLRSFYDCGLDWGGTGGLASFTAALSICLLIFQEERIAENIFECFKAEYINNFPEGNFEMEIELSAFLKKYNLRLQPNLYSRFCYAALLDSREILMYRDPRSGLITVNLADNYAEHNHMIANQRLRELNTRRERLVFRLFAKDKTIITGYDFDTVMEEVEAIMAKFYWESLERLIKKQIRPGNSGIRKDPFTDK
jgi:hypothetical protein